MAYYDPAIDTFTLPPVDPPSWQASNNDESEVFNRDRFRLGRELARDFEDVSFSSLPPPGDETDTIASAASFDISKDANATSTKRITPHIPIRAPAGPPDFTMVAEGIQDTDVDSYEVGRKRNSDTVSFVNQSTDFFSIGAPSIKKNESKKRTGGKIDDKRRGSISSYDGVNNHQRKNDRKVKPQNVDRSLGSPVQRSTSFPNLSFSPPPTRTPRRVKSRLPSPGSGDRPSKITDYVSNSGSGGSMGSMFVNPTLNPRDSEEDALSDIGGAAGRQWVGTTGSRRNGSNRIPSPTRRRRRDIDIAEGVPVVLARTRKSNSADTAPKSFKSTADFLKELGLDGHTQTINLQTTLKGLKDVGSTSHPQTKYASTLVHNLNLEPSFMIPHMPDMTDLFSGNEVTRFSAKKGTAAKSHFPIESIPIPRDTRAMLTAMKLLQEKVANLEDNKAANEHKCAKLETELRRTEVKYQQENRKARLAEEEMRRRGRPDSAFGGSDDGDVEQRERGKIDWMMEKLKLESIITTLRGDIKQIHHELQTARIALDKMQEERNSAIDAVAMAISSNEDLKAANSDLRSQLEQMEYEKRQVEKHVTRQRDEHRAREEKLRQYAKDARQAAAVAEKAIKETARVDSRTQRAADRKAANKQLEDREERQEMERLMKERIEEEREEQRRSEVKYEFDRRVEMRLREIRPDLFSGRSEPFVAPSGGPSSQVTVGVEGRGGFIPVPKSRRTRMPPSSEASQVDIIPKPKGKQREHQPLSEKAVLPVEATGPAGADDSTMSISQEEVRRIAKEINTERKKRKAAAAAEKVRQEGERHRGTEQQSVESVKPAAQSIPAATEQISSLEPNKLKGRKIVKVVYLMDGDTTEILNLEQEIQAGLEDARIDGGTNPVLKPTGAPVVSMPAAKGLVAASGGVEQLLKGPQLEPEKGPARVSESQPAAVLGPRDTFNTPAPPLTVPLHPFTDHASESHDPRQCTVCVRYNNLRRREEEAEQENPLRDIDNSCLFPAPELEAASKRPTADDVYDGETTFRPSVCPKTQLERVVRQLKDEFRHLKLMYQRKSEEFMELDPAIQKKKRKALTREMNELVSEMDAKSDQIYALYDVNEEFVDREKQKEYEVGEETEDLIRSLEAV